eukprot:109387_1
MFNMGGDNALGHAGDVLDSIEKLSVSDIPNINQYAFNVLDVTLSHKKSGIRAVLVGTDIYILGGSVSVGGKPSSWNGTVYDDIEVIDTISDIVTIRGRLYEPINGVAPILISNRVYVFGGFKLDTPVTYWQYFDMLSHIDIYVDAFIVM